MTVAKERIDDDHDDGDQREPDHQHRRSRLEDSANERSQAIRDEDGGEKPENIEESSKQERSRLDYRNVKSDLSPAQKDLLNQDRIPWEYRPLIKDYFQAIRPTAKKQDKE